MDGYYTGDTAMGRSFLQLDDGRWYAADGTGWRVRLAAGEVPTNLRSVTRNPDGWGWVPC